MGLHRYRILFENRGIAKSPIHLMEITFRILEKIQLVMLKWRSINVDVKDGASELG